VGWLIWLATTGAADGLTIVTAIKLPTIQGAWKISSSHWKLISIGRRIMQAAAGVGTPMK
jgi:hypothetical protein